MARLANFHVEGISTSNYFHHPFQIEGARWHLLRTIAGPRLGADLVPALAGAGVPGPSSESLFPMSLVVHF